MLAYAASIRYSDKSVVTIIWPSTHCIVTTGYYCTPMNLKISQRKTPNFKIPSKCTIRRVPVKSINIIELETELFWHQGRYSPLSRWVSASSPHNRVHEETDRRACLIHTAPAEAVLWRWCKRIRAYVRVVFAALIPSLTKTSENYKV